jgi:hypothetical protein
MSVGGIFQAHVFPGMGRPGGVLVQKLPPSAECNITFEIRDGSAREPQEGEYIVTQGKRVWLRSAYQILRSRRVKRKQADALPKFILHVQRLGFSAEIDRLADWRMTWDSRGKKA